MNGVSYDRLREMLIERRMRKTELARGCGIDNNILAKIMKDDYITLRTLEKVCRFLDCDIGDVVRLRTDDDVITDVPPERKMSWKDYESALFGDEGLL